MKKRLPHIIPFLFLGFLLLPILCMVGLQGAQWYLKSTAGERMEHHRVLSFQMPAAEAIWHKKGKELSINGKLFDIKYYSIHKGILHVTGYFDHEETTVTRLLSLFLPGRKQSPLLHFFLVLQCFMAPLVFLSYTSAFRKSKTIFSRYTFYLPTPFYLTEGHPPECRFFY